MNSSVEVARLLLDIGAVQAGTFTLSSGGTSSVYIDNRRIISFPLVRDRIVELLVDAASAFTFDCISATAMGAIPFGTLVADRMRVPMVYVRPAKGHGLQNTVEGYLKPDSRVLIVEDHVTTGNSVIANAEAIRAIGGCVSGCIAITSNDGARDRLTQAAIRLVVLTMTQEILDDTEQTLHSAMTATKKCHYELLTTTVPKQKLGVWDGSVMANADGSVPVVTMDGTAGRGPRRS